MIVGNAFRIRRSLTLLFLCLVAVMIIVSPVVSQGDDGFDDSADEVVLEKRLALQIEAPKDSLAWGDEALIRLTAANVGEAEIENVALHLHSQPGIVWGDEFKGQWLELGSMVAGDSRVFEGHVRIEGRPSGGLLPLFATLQGHDVEPVDAKAELSVPPLPAEEVTVAKEGSLVQTTSGRVQFAFPNKWNEDDARLTFHLREEFHRPTGEAGRLLLFTIEAAANDALVEAFDATVAVEIDLNGLIDMDWATEHPPLITTRKNDKENWTAIESTFDPKTGRVSFATNHFSEYQATVEPEVWKLQYNPPGASAYSGAATHHYPIETPPGIGGLKPDLSLNYSSRPAEGIRFPAVGQGFGAGWSMPEARIINSNTGDMYTPPENPDWPGRHDFRIYNFSLILNGVTYYLKGQDTQGARGYGVYQALGDASLRIEFIPHGHQGKPENNTNNVTGEFWRVRTPDGTTYTFGKTEDAEQVIWPVDTLPLRNGGQPRNDSFSAYNWKLDSVVDVHGNKIVYVYETSCGVYFAGGANREGNLEGGGKECTEVDTAVKEIHYNFDGGTAQTKILFEYESMNYNQTRQEKSMTAGVFRPTEIKVQQGATTISNYTLTYTGAAHYFDGWDISTQFWHLMSITRKGVGGTETLPVQTFVYGQDSETCADGACVKLLTRVDNGYGAVTVLGFTNIAGTRWNYVSTVDLWDGVAAKYGANPRPQSRHKYTPSVVPDNDPETIDLMWCYDKPFHANNNTCYSRAVPGEGSGSLIGVDAMTIETQRPTNPTGSGWTMVAKEKQVFHNDNYWQLGKLNERQQFDNAGMIMKDVYVWDIVTSGNYVQTRVSSETHTLAPSGTSLTSSIAYTYEALNPGGDSFGALKTRLEKDETGANFRCTEYTYAQRTSDTWLVNRIAQETVKSGGCSGTKMAETRYRYADSGNTNNVGLDSRGLLTYVLRWVGGSTNVVEKFTYTAQGLLKDSITYQNTISGTSYPGSANIYHKTTTTFNALGVPNKITTDDGDTNIGYNGTFPWLVASVEDPNKIKTLYGYDNFGRLNKVATMGDTLSSPTISYDYYDDGGNNTPKYVSPLLVAIVYKNNIKSAERQLYDGLGRLVQTQIAKMEVDGSDKDVIVSIAYDARGLEVCRTVPYTTAVYVYNGLSSPSPFKTAKCSSKSRTTIDYDYLGRLTSVTAPGGTQTSTSYGVTTNITIHGHSRFLRTTVTDGNNHVVNRYSDVFGRLAMVREFTGNSTATYNDYADTRYKYNVLGNLLEVGTSAPNNNQPGSFLRQTTMSYNPLGRKVSMNDPDMGQWYYQYDPNGNLIRQQDPNNVLCFRYDNLSRLTQRFQDINPGANCPATPAGSDVVLASYQYGTSESNNNIGRLVEVSWGPSPGTNNDNYTYEADQGGTETKGRLVKQTRRIDGETFAREITVYDALDRPTSVKLPSGEVVVTGYDEEGVDTLKAGSTTLISGVGYNERGQMVALKRANGAPNTTLSYYGAAKNFRLSAITTAGSATLPDFTYSAYDNVGNLTSFGINGSGYTYQYDDLNRLKEAAGAIVREYSYDQLGNFDEVKVGGLVRKYTYAPGQSSRLMTVSNLPLTVDAVAGYDTLGNMRKYTLQNNAYELTFDAENRLASVKVGTAQPTVFSYDADGQRVMTTDPDGNIIYSPYPDYEMEDPSSSGANIVRTTYRLGGQIVAVQKKVGSAAGTFYYAFTDHLGNITALSAKDGTPESGSITRYDPFGPFTTVAPTTNPSISSHGFTGHRHNNTGTNDLDLIYMNARYYMPLVGRFISPDTIVPDPGNPQSYNRYGYVRNNPVNLTDPSGHMECSGIQGECGYPTPRRTPTKGASSGESNGSGPSIVKETLGDLFDIISVENPRVEPQPGSANLTEWLVGQMSQTAQTPLVLLLHALWTSPDPVGNKYLVLVSWARLVATGAIWDFKGDILDQELTFGIGLVQLGNHGMSYEAVANIFYGFIGRQIGMSELLLQGGAGLAQMEHGFGHWKANLGEYPAGLGDQPFDAWAVGFGFVLHDQFGNDINALTVTSFTDSLDSYISTNLPPLMP